MAQSSDKCSSFAIPIDRREHGDRCAFAILVRASVCGCRAAPFACARALSRAVATQVEHDSSGNLRNVYLRLPSSMNGCARNSSGNAGALPKNIRVPLAHAIPLEKLEREAIAMARLAVGCDALLRT